MLNATNEVCRLTQQLIEVGDVLNKAEIGVLEAIGKEDKRKAKVIRQQAKGKYKEIQVRIRAQKEIINSLKVSIRAEGSHL
jgi:putative lipoic acid-binding regulatory protein